MERLVHIDHHEDEDDRLKLCVVMKYQLIQQMWLYEADELDEVVVRVDQIDEILLSYDLLFVDEVDEVQKQAQDDDIL